MAIQTSFVTLPATYAIALVNGDYSGLEPQEERHVRKIVVDLAESGMTIIGTTENEPRFTWLYSMYNGLADGGEVLDYIVMVR